MKWGAKALVFAATTALFGCGSGDSVSPTGQGAGGGVLTGATTATTSGDTSSVASTSSTTSSSSSGGGGGGEGGALPFVCAGKGAKSGTDLVSLMHDGIVRTSLVHAPANYDPTQGTMLVVNLHGFSSDAPQEELLSKMTPLADERGFVVAYPYGVFASWNAGQCCGTAWTNSVDDVGFINALLDEIASEYCIDPKRVFATGMSNGGFMSHRLGCELATRFAAIAPVAGVLGIPVESCTPPRAVPIIDFHGTGDPIVPYDGGVPLVQWDTGGLLDFPSVDESMNAWAAIDGCDGGQEISYQNGDTTCVRWLGCKEGSEVVRCASEGAGHTWPSGLELPGTSHDIDASATMLDFFAAHPMP